MASQSTEDVNLDEMRLGGMSDARESGEGRMDEVVRGGREAEAFRNSLVLTRDEKKFALAREIARSGEEAFRYQERDSMQSVFLFLIYST